MTDSNTASRNSLATKWSSLSRDEIHLTIVSRIKAAASCPMCGAVGYFHGNCSQGCSDKSHKNVENIAHRNLWQFRGTCTTTSLEITETVHQINDLSSTRHSVWGIANRRNMTLARAVNQTKVMVLILLPQRLCDTLNNIINEFFSELIGRYPPLIPSVLTKKRDSARLKPIVCAEKHRLDKLEKRDWNSYFDALDFNTSAEEVRVSYECLNMRLGFLTVLLIQTVIFLSKKVLTLSRHILPCVEGRSRSQHSIFALRINIDFSDFIHQYCWNLSNVIGFHQGFSSLRRIFRIEKNEEKLFRVDRSGIEHVIRYVHWM